jgi:hypothetical protein
MKRILSVPVLNVVAACALFGSAGRAEVNVVVNHNDNDKATADFKFKEVPSPAKNDAAAKAKLTIIDGDRDPNSGELEKVNDGKVPTEEDQPDENFFFAQRADGGRIGIDLGKAIDINEVNTYSWHPNTRGPQVYKLYASDGAAADFKAEPKRDTDPEKVGWKLIAKVDTRPKEGEGGGQYGVNITDSNGPLGKFRYLLFDVRETENDDPFGNTFYSEIDVIEHK